MAFIGQAKNGLSQKEQQKVVSDFRSGGYNVLVATSIGEEGLDIGEVDLIICFDASSSPIRMIQRMGRTGRKRDGRCVMLMTSDETGVQKRSETKSKSMVKSMLDSKNFIFYQNKASLVWRRLIFFPRRGRL
jgi:ERCC4-related helicase